MIELTTTTDNRLAILAENITAVMEHDAGHTVVSTKDNIYCVKQSYSTLMALISQARADAVAAAINAH